jgi:hypothetical protein
MITLDGTNGITTPDLNATAQTSNLVTTGDISAADLTLSGGVYLGGTGSANLLDDYEEGTWTPTLNNHNGSAGSTIAGRYVKVGRIVHCVGVITQNSGTVSGGTLQLASLPFTATQFGSAAVDSAGVGVFVIDGGRIEPGWNFVDLKLNGVVISSGTNSVNICFSVTYETT